MPLYGLPGSLEADADTELFGAIAQPAEPVSSCLNITVVVGMGPHAVRAEYRGSLEEAVGVRGNLTVRVRRQHVQEGLDVDDPDAASAIALTPTSVVASSSSSMSHVADRTRGDAQARPSGFGSRSRRSRCRS